MFLESIRRPSNSKFRMRWQQHSLVQQHTGGTAAVPFANIPGGVGTAPWDFTQGDGMKLHNHSTKAFDPKYDGKQGGLRHFLRNIQLRANKYGWAGILNIPGEGGTVRQLTTQYGALTRANVRDHAISYVNAHGRLEQGSNMLLDLVRNSIEPTLLDELELRREHYTVTVGTAPNTTDIESGAALLFELISHVSIETRVTIFNLTHKLSDLTALLRTHGGDIRAFVLDVTDTFSSLRERNAPVPDVLVNLFTAFKSHEDKEFSDYIKFKLRAYQDNTLDLTATELMELALQQYKVLTTSGEWMKKTPEQLEILAMRVQLEAAKQSKTKKKTPKGKSDKNKDKFAWKDVAPKDGEPLEKTVNGKDYFHCPHHGTTQWVLAVNNGIVHKTGCRRAQAAAAGQTPTALSSVASDADAPKQAKQAVPTQSEKNYARALAAVMEEHQDLASDSDDE